MGGHGAPVPQGQSEDAADICFLSAVHPPLDKRVFQKEARSLTEAGFRVTHVCPDDGLGSRVQNGVRIRVYPRRRPGGKIGRLLSLVDLYRIGRSVGAPCYHCNEPDSWLVGVVLRLRYKRMVVFDAHEHYPSAVDRWVPAPLVPSSRVAVRAALEFLGLFTQVVVLAKGSVAGDYSLSRRRHVLVLNCAPLKDPPPGTGHKGPFRFVHSGLFSRSRGAFVLLDALALVKEKGLEASVVLAGGFNDGSEEEFDRRAQELGVSHMIEKVGWVSYDESMRVVAGCDAGLVLFTKHIENNVRAMPHKMFDYMAARLPFIAPDFAPEVTRILNDAGCAILVDTDETEAVGEAMVRLIRDRELGQWLGKRGRAAVEERYNWEQEATKLVAAYQRLLPPELRSAPTAGRP